MRLNTCTYGISPLPRVACEHAAASRGSRPEGASRPLPWRWHTGASGPLGLCSHISGRGWIHTLVVAGLDKTTAHSPTDTREVRTDEHIFEDGAGEVRALKLAARNHRVAEHRRTHARACTRAGGRCSASGACAQYTPSTQGRAAAGSAPLNATRSSTALVKSAESKLAPTAYALLMTTWEARR